MSVYQALSLVPMEDDRLWLEVQYIREIIPEAEVNVILDHFVTALRSLIRNPHATIGDVSLIGPKELEVLMQPKVHHSASNSYTNVTQMVEAQVLKTPQRIAVRHI